MEGKNPSHTGIFLNAYDKREFSSEEVIAREGGQNASDAGRDIPGTTVLEFQKIKFKGKNKEKLIRLFDFESALKTRVKGMSERNQDKPVADGIKELLKTDEITCLLIRDFHTCGLGGKWDSFERGNHFARLVTATNLDDKSDSENLGGSFGAGKTEYAKSSKIRTVIYHSVFQETAESEGAYRRLMAAGVYPKHTNENDSATYSGFGYFGTKVKRDGRYEAAPFVNEEAESIWNAIQELTEHNSDISRNKGETGTDILIFMDSLDLAEIKRAIEDYYFPALLDGQLAVHFIDFDGERESPNPNDRTDLDQFINLWKRSKEKKPIKKDELVVDRFRKIKDKNLGWYAFEEAEEDEAKTKKNNTVALSRGTGMIINYVPCGSDRYESAVGFFEADDDVAQYLRSSENAAHSEWNSDQDRLKNAFGEDGQKTVASINKQIKDKFGAFQRNLQPDVSYSRTQVGLLSRLLSKALSGKASSETPPEGERRPFAVETDHSRSDSQSIWSLIISENEDTPDGEIDIRVTPRIAIAGDSKLVAVKKKPFKVFDGNGKEVDGENLDFKFKKGVEIKLTVKFDNPGNLNYLVKFPVVVSEGG